MTLEVYLERISQSMLPDNHSCSILKDMGRDILSQDGVLGDALLVATHLHSK
jgi:hypothetical protein